MKEETRTLRHDRHTVSLLTDHMVFAPKYRGKILTGDVAMNMLHSIKSSLHFTLRMR